MPKKAPLHVELAMGQAVTLYQSGRLDEASTFCRQVLQWQPQHFAAVNLLGVIAARSNLPEQAVELFAAAIRIDRKSAATHNNLGNTLQSLGQYAAAVASYNKAIALKRDYADAYKNRGHALRALLKHAEALASYEKAIELDPRSASSHYSRGNAFCDLGRHSAAIACYDEAIALKSDYADAFYNRGNALVVLKQHMAAIASYDAAIALKRDYWEALHNRGKALSELRQFEAAITSFDAAVAHGANRADACCDTGFALQQLNQLDAALDKFDQAISIQPTHIQSHINRGVVLRQLNRVDAALASYNHAIALEPDFVAAYQNRGYASLLAGDYANGWADYEYRLKSGSLIDLKRDFRQPRWGGAESIAGKTILLYAEQGLGDTLQFCRYAKLVAELGARIILEVQSPLQSLLTSLEGVAQVLAHGDALPAFDFHCSLMSLPFALKTTLASIPAQIPYLESDGAKVRHWREKMGEKRKPRIGLVWSGGFRTDRPELCRRNIPLKKLARLYRPEVEFYSLQKGQPAESELADLSLDDWGGPKPLDYTDLLSDFSDTAALVENLDLIIAVDTSTAHLAGALGKPVWLLNRFDTCWRWLLDRADSPWYPTMRLYRQPRAGDWDAVIEAVESDLSRHTLITAPEQTPPDRA